MVFQKIQKHRNPKHLHKIYPEDVAQLVFGAMILAVPIAFTEETWRLGESLHHYNIIVIFGLSVFLIALAIFHSGLNKKHTFGADRLSYFTRVFLTYAFVFLTVGVFLTLIDKAPWMTEPILAVRRTVLISLPASLSGVATDLVH